MRSLGIFYFTLLCTFSLNAEKVVLISGSTGGIGEATVCAFQKEGWSVWAGYRSHIPDSFRDQNNIHPIYLDVRDPESINSSIKEIIKAEGKIDVLINNAGYGILGSDELIAPEEIEKLFEVNFFGALRLIQQVAPFMKKEHSGHIINISSTSGVRAVPGLGAYAASKFALEGLSEALAVTLSPWNIHVVVVEPGTVKNDWASHCQSDHSKLAANLLQKLTTLAKNGQEPRDIASLLLRIANDPHPDMRYQTSPQVQTTLKEKLVDLSGNAMREKQTTFFHSLMNDH